MGDNGSECSHGQSLQAYKQGLMYAVAWVHNKAIQYDYSSWFIFAEWVVFVYKHCP